MQVTRQEFTWSETDEPHASRRKEILAKHPEIANLFGKEPRTFPIVCFIFVTQLLWCYYLQDKSWGLILVVAYVYGGTVNHTLQLAVHELSHNLCWPQVWANQLTGIFGNLVTGFPSAVSFRGYHMAHHQFQGVEGVDMDIGTPAEVRIFNSLPRKILWLFLQPVFYAARPLIVDPKTPGAWELLNSAVQFTFDGIILYYFGYKALLYLIIGTLLGLGLHPCAGHFVAEHYELTLGSETYSYYGPCNYFNFNVGYHNEHHDFPRIPWSKLPMVRKIAPEFYNNLPHYTSYLYVFWRYITDPNIGPAARIKRLEKYSVAAKDKSKSQ